MQLFASIACAWMLFSLFGVRRRALFPLALYLSSAITLPATMWWAAALNALPLQITCFVAITAWVRYLATGRRRWLVLLFAALAFGLLSYVKTVLLFGVLVYVLMAWFSSGTLKHRLVSTVRERWRVLSALVVIGLVFLVYYTTQVPQITGTVGLDQPAPLAGTMLGRVLPVGLVGGPWRWDTRSPPTALANPPQFALSLSWVLLALALLVILVGRRRTGRAWVLLGLYAFATYLLLLTTRAALLSDLAGLEYRYLTDVMPILVFCLGVGTMTLRGSPEPSVTRPEASSISPAVGGRLRGALAVLVAVAVRGRHVQQHHLCADLARRQPQRALRARRTRLVGREWSHRPCRPVSAPGRDNPILRGEEQDEHPGAAVQQGGALSAGHGGLGGA